MSNAIFTPALGEQISNAIKRKLTYKGKDGNDYSYKFFDKTGFFDYDYMLQSIYYAKTGVWKGQNFRDSIGYDKNKTLISDSGGFQLASFKKRGETCPLTPIDSLRWQEENFDIGMNLDIPPNLDGQPSYQDFMLALKESKQNFTLFEKERKNYDMHLLNVLHGETIPLAETWYNEVKNFNFDGWAIGIKPPYDGMLQAQGFMYLLQKGEFDKSSCKNIHFFGTSGKNVVPTLVYLAHKFGKNKMITYDSSSYNVGSIFRTYFLPYDIGGHLCFGDIFKTENPLLTQLPCCCPVCKQINTVDDLNTGELKSGILCSLHNMYQYIQYNQLLNSLVAHKDKFIEYLKLINIGEKTLKSIEFIDCCEERGIEDGVKFFSDWLIPQDIKKNKQVNLFNF